MAAKGRRFSFMRLINNAIPNFARDDVNDVDLSPRQADDLVEYQLTLSNPRFLDSGSYYVAGLTDSKSISEKVHKALLKAHVVSAPTADRSLSPVITSAIGKNFAHQLSCISVHAQRKLVGLLFFWEEECTRWKLLDQEESEILQAMGQQGMDDRNLDMALRAVEMKKRLLPSKRAEATANINGSGIGHELPGYS